MAKKGKSDKHLVNALEVVSVTRSLAVVNFFHFLFAGAKACLFPFLTLYFRQLGLTGLQTGVIIGAKSLMTLITVPLWARCASKFSYRRCVLLTSMFLLITTYLCLTLVPPVNREDSLMFCTNQHETPTTQVPVESEPYNNDMHSASQYTQGITPPSPTIPPPYPTPKMYGNKIPSSTLKVIVPLPANNNDSSVLEVQTTVSTKTTSFTTEAQMESTSPEDVKSSKVKPVEFEHPKPFELSPHQVKLIMKKLGLTKEDIQSLSLSDLKSLLHEYNKNHKSEPQEESKIDTKDKKVTNRFVSTTEKNPAAELNKHPKKFSLTPEQVNVISDRLGLTKEEIEGLSIKEFTSLLRESQEKNKIDTKEKKVTNKFVDTTETSPAEEVNKPPKKFSLTPEQVDLISDKLGLTKDEIESLSTKELTSLLHAYNQKHGTSEHSRKSHTFDFGEKQKRSAKKTLEKGVGTREHSAPEAPENENENENENEEAENGGSSGKGSGEGWYTKMKDKISNLQESMFSLEYRTFLITLVIVLIGEMFASPVDEVADDAWYDYLDDADDLEKYGQHSLWSLLGTDICAIAVTLIVDNTDCLLKFKINHFMVHFYLFAAIAILGFFVVFCYPVNLNTKSLRRRRHAWKAWRLICCDLRCFTFTMSLFISGILSAATFNFLFWQIQDLGGKEIMMGLTITVGACSEIPMFFIGRWLAGKLSCAAMICLGLLSQAGQLVFFAFLWAPWAAIPISLLNMFINTGMWSGVLSHPDFITNHHMSADRSVKAVLRAIHFSFGFAIGSIMSGYVYDTFGFRNLFIGAGIVGGVWGVLFALLQRCVRKKEKIEYSKLLNTEDELVSDSSEDLYEEDWLKNAKKT